MSRFLETMVQRSKERVALSSRRSSVDELRESVIARPGPRDLGSFGGTFDLIAEIKPRSPSEGGFPTRSPAATAHGYEAGGAAMISVLTEPSEFGGSLAALEKVSEAVGIPVLAKDFIVDPYQVYQARLAGADGVLVIARILGDDEMATVLDAVVETGMFALVEAFDAEDLDRLINAAAERANVLVGVNCRDLDTLDLVPSRHQELAAFLPPGSVTVAESAMITPADIERVAALGYGAALVGSALMRAADAGRLVREMVEAGRRTAVVAP